MRRLIATTDFGEVFVKKINILQHYIYDNEPFSKCITTSGWFGFVTKKMATESVQRIKTKKLHIRAVWNLER